MVAEKDSIHISSDVDWGKATCFRASERDLNGIQGDFTRGKWIGARKRGNEQRGEGRREGRKERAGRGRVALHPAVSRSFAVAYGLICVKELENGATSTKCPVGRLWGGCAAHLSST